jgi:hypothetical protein
MRAHRLTLGRLPAPIGSCVYDPSSSPGPGGSLMWHGYWQVTQVRSRDICSRSLLCPTCEQATARCPHTWLPACLAALQLPP